MAKNNYWFKAKKYGWGWYPSTWQGFTVLGLYISVLIILFYNIDVYSPSAPETIISFLPQWIVLTVILFLVCIIKGEKPRWRWGR